VGKTGRTQASIKRCPEKTNQGRNLRHESQRGIHEQLVLEWSSGLCTQPELYLQNIPKVDEINLLQFLDEISLPFAHFQ
jgi:hypothetical protein